MICDIWKIVYVLTVFVILRGEVENVLNVGVRGFFLGFFNKRD